MTLQFLGTEWSARRLFCLFLYQSQLFIFRHVYKDLSLGTPLIFTVGLILLLFVVIGFFGGVLAASFYDSFLKAVEAKNREPTIQTFFAEWLFALSAPVLGLLALGILSGTGDGFY